MAGNIFISYRRDDAAAWAGRLHMALERHFRREQIFMDVDSIQAGLDFAKVIDAEVAKCDVMLVVIGKDWLDVRNAAGRRRLDDPSDFVRLEVESALRRDIRVVPVLVDGAKLPKAEELPEGMQGLVRRQAWPLSHARFGAESEGLVGEISRYVTPAGGTAAAPARTDWAAEASRFFLLTLAGLAVVVAIAVGSSKLAGGTWLQPTYGAMDAAMPARGIAREEYLKKRDAYFRNNAFTRAAIHAVPPYLLWLVLSIWAFMSAPWRRGSDLAALWVTSIMAVWALFLAGEVALDVARELNFDVGGLKTSAGDMAYAFSIPAVLYALLSGPALILWRRRKRRG